MISNINTKLSTAAPQRTQSAARPEQAAQAADAFVASEPKLESRLQATAQAAQALEGTLSEHVPGEVIVKMKADTGLQSSVSSDLGLEVIEKLDLPQNMVQSMGGELLRLKLPEGVSVEQGLAMLRADERIAYAETNDILHHTGQATLPNDLDPKLWGLDNQGQNGGKVDSDIDAPEAWKFSVGKNQANGGPLIAVIDTGTDVNHPDLKANLWTNPGEIAGNGIDDDGNGVIDDVHGFNAIDGSGNPVDDVGHGSHCAGTIGAVGNNGQGITGVIQEANLMPVKFLGRNGGTLGDAIKALAYADKMGARVTSNSWGGGGFNQALRDTLANSQALHIFAAGNESNNNDARPAYPASYDLPNIISVAALDRNDGLARFSNYGKTSVDLGAPGVDIYSTTPGGKFQSMNGTSMAAPHVTGAAGLLLAMNPELSNSELKDLLMNTTDKVASLEGKSVTGGRLNIGTAAEKLAGQQPPADPSNPPSNPPASGSGCAV